MMLVSKRYLPFIRVNPFAALFYGLAHDLQIVGGDRPGKPQELSARQPTWDRHGQRAREFQYPPLQFVRQAFKLFNYFVHHKSTHFALRQHLSLATYLPTCDHCSTTRPEKQDA